MDEQKRLFAEFWHRGSTCCSAQAIVTAVYKFDALSAVIDVYLEPVESQTWPNRIVPNYEFRFEAQMSMFNAPSTSSQTSQILVSLTAFMLLENSYVDSSQRISVLAAAAQPADSSNSDTTTDDFLKKISYD